MQKKISVIVPVYRVEKYLRKCVESILAQTYKNLEVILVDDGGDDTCPQICDEYAELDDRVKVIHKQNGGTQSAIIAGAKISTGEFIGFVDGDDYISPVMYEELYAAILKNTADIAMCGINFVGEGEDDALGKDFGDNTYRSGENIDTCLRLLLDTKYLFAPNRFDKLYRRDVVVDCLGKADKRIAYGEDLDLNLYIFQNIKTVTTVSGRYYCYFQRATSVTKVRKSHYFTSYVHLIEHLTRLAGDVPALRADICRYVLEPFVLREAVFFIKQGKYKEAKQVINEKNAAFWLKSKRKSKLSFRKKLTVFLLNLHAFWVVRLLYKIKKSV